MTPPSDQKPERRSHQIKPNTHLAWNFCLEDFRKPAMTQAPAGNASLDGDQDRKQGPSRASDCRKYSAHERDEQRQWVMCPSVDSLGSHKITSINPTHSPRKGASSAKVSTTQPMNVTWSSTSESEVKTSGRDTILLHVI